MSKDKLPDNVIPFPNVQQRVGKKYRQEEISRIQDMLILLGQIDQLQLELTSLTHEYEKLTERLKHLLLVEDESDD